VVTYLEVADILYIMLQLSMVLIKVADISNEARPMDVAEPWLDRLLQVKSLYPSLVHRVTGMKFKFPL